MILFQCFKMFSKDHILDDIILIKTCYESAKGLYEMLWY